MSTRLVGVLATALAATGACRLPAGERPSSREPDAPPPAVFAPREIPRGQTFVVAAAGDIAGRTHAHRATADLLLDLLSTKGLALVLPLGDLQYPRGSYTDFMFDYDRSWGVPELKAITRPVPGNHEYDHGRSSADGYFDYWNGIGQAVGPAGRRGQGYYSFDVGDWHFVALNTSDGCRSRISCAIGSPMHRWLVTDLAAHHRRCVLAYFHHPRFQHGAYHGPNAVVAPLWDALYDAGVDVVLGGHEHNFQQLSPLDKRGRPDPERGIRSFIVGTGGARPYVELDGDHGPLTLEAAAARRFGVLELTLGDGHYSWRFLTTGRAEPFSAGRDVCR